MKKKNIPVELDPTKLLHLRGEDVIQEEDLDLWGYPELLDATLNALPKFITLEVEDLNGKAEIALNKDQAILLAEAIISYFK